MASSITQAREGTLYLMAAAASRLSAGKADSRKAEQSMRYIGKAGQAANVKALVNMVMNINTAGLAEGLGLGEALGARSRHVAGGVLPNGRGFPRVADRRRRHAESRALLLFPRRARRQRFRDRAGSGKREKLNLPLAAATKKQYDRMVAEGLGELDKSGIAELTFRGRLKKKKK